MSLINDALKKAQQQRADDAAAPARPPAVTPTTTPAPVHTPSPATAATRATSPSRLQEQPRPVARPVTTPSIRYQTSSPKDPVSPKTLWLCLGAIALVLVSVGITMTLTKKTAEPVAVAKSLPVQPTPRPVSPARTVGSTSALGVQPVELPAPTIAPVEAAPAPVVSLPVAAPAQPTPAAPAPVQAVAADTPAVSLPANAATPAPSASALPPIYAPRAPTPVNPSAHIQNFIDRIRVTGIRRSDTGSRVILNYRMFKTGDTVDSGLEVKLIKIEDGVLTFADSSGKTYIKLFQ